MKCLVGQQWGARFGPVALMRSQIDYGNTVYGSAAKSALTALYKHLDCIQATLNYVRSRGNVSVSEKEMVDSQLHSHGHPTNEWRGREHSDGQVMKFPRRRGVE